MLNKHFYTKLKKYNNIEIINGSFVNLAFRNLRIACTFLPVENNEIITNKICNIIKNLKDNEKIYIFYNILNNSFVFNFMNVDLIGFYIEEINVKIKLSDIKISNQHDL